MSLALQSAPRFHAPSAEALGDTLAAFHVLMWAYTNEVAPKVRLLPGGEHVGFPIVAEVSVGELRRRARAQLRTVGVSGEMDRAQLTWRGASDGEAFSVDWSAPDGPEFARVTFPARIRFARRHWHTALATVASPAAQGLRAGDVDLLDAQERVAILNLWSGAGSPLPADPAWEGSPARRSL